MRALVIDYHEIGRRRPKEIAATSFPLDWKLAIGKLTSGAGMLTSQDW